jgi:peptide/nickel transport system permease protein
MRNPMALAGILLLALIIFCAVAAPVIAPADPYYQNIGNRLAPPFWEAKGSPANILGTDQLGRDILSRIIYGARVSLALGFLCTILSSMIGVSLGLLAGMGPARVGDAIMRLADAQIAFPFLVLAIAVIAVFGPGFVNLVIILSVFGWVHFARVVRGDALSMKEKEFIDSARTVGLPEWRIAVRHVLPNVLSPVIVIWTFAIAQIVIVESSLSFLGLGVQPPTPSWGSMLSDGRGYLETAWWLGTFPGVAIMLTVLAVNFVGDGLRDALDPRLRS